MDLELLISNITLYALPVLFAITVHEAAHGFAARHFGDNTAWMLGRVTLNPMRHIDPVGTILMPAIMLLTTFAIPGGPFVLGYAKPVPIRFGNLRNPKRDMVWVALAGPAANLAMALVWGILLLVLRSSGVTEPFFLKMCIGGVGVNITIFAFNLFPIPPLDGGRILVGLLPYRQAAMVASIEPFGFFIVIALVIARVINDIWMQPVMAITYSLLNFILTPIASLLGI